MTLTLVLSLTAQAHLMPGGRGTLNVKDDAVFMVLSLPVGVLGELDENRDGRVSLAEFNAGRAQIVDAIEEGIWLDDGMARQAPQDILLAPEASHEGERIDAVSVLARFPLNETGRRPAAFGIPLLEGHRDVIVVTARRRMEDLKARLELAGEQRSDVFRWSQAAGA